MNIIITGATGMVGTEVLAEALADCYFTSVTAIVRRPLSILHPKLKTIIHKDYLNYTGLEDVFATSDACVWCLGISQNQVSEEEYNVITYDYTVAAASAMLAANPAISFLFLSAEGATLTEQSRVLFCRVKGRTENALLAMPFEKLYIAHPAGIIPSTNTGNFTFTLQMQYSLMRLFRYITPKYVITSEELARAMLYVLKNGISEIIVSCGALKQLARETT